MRHLISTLQTHNQQMKGEVVKYKIRLRETQSELNQVSQKGKLTSKSYILLFVGTTCSSIAEHNSTSNWNIDLLPLQVRASKGNAILQSQSSTEMDVKDETTSPSTPAVSGEPVIKTEPDNGSSTPSSTGN